ncbi:MAG: hypothetical protein ACREOZ_03955 [Gloeomargaritales cyanobacterium]
MRQTRSHNREGMRTRSQCAPRHPPRQERNFAQYVCARSVCEVQCLLSRFQPCTKSELTFIANSCLLSNFFGFTTCRDGRISHLRSSLLPLLPQGVYIGVA